MYHVEVTSNEMGMSLFIYLVILDINECEIDNGGCEQQCSNVILSFTCDCNEGYILEENGRTCAG